MLQKLQKDERGFTIIEVLIVLAIGGLIMLIVFLAIPALQRNQRNNARNNDASRISSAISECLANRNGRTGTTNGECGMPASINVGERSQLTEQFTLHTGTLSSNPNSPTTNTSTTAAQYRFGAVCTSAGTGAVSDANTRNFVVLYSLEPAVTRCIGSQSN